MLFLDGNVYADMAQYRYNVSQWRNMQLVLAEAMRIHRIRKKFDELRKKDVILINDELTMRRKDMDDATVAFSASVGTQSSTLSSIANNGYCSFTNQSIRPIFNSAYEQLAKRTMSHGIVLAQLILTKPSSPP